MVASELMASDALAQQSELSRGQLGPRSGRPHGAPHLPPFCSRRSMQSSCPCWHASHLHSDRRTNGQLEAQRGHSGACVWTTKQGCNTCGLQPGLHAVEAGRGAPAPSCMRKRPHGGAAKVVLCVDAGPRLQQQLHRLPEALGTRQHQRGAPVCGTAWHDERFFH